MRPRPSTTKNAEHAARERGKEEQGLLRESHKRFAELAHTIAGGLSQVQAFLCVLCVLCGSFFPLLDHKERRARRESGKDTGKPGQEN